jgi:hypothetical protein
VAMKAYDVWQEVRTVLKDEYEDTRRGVRVTLAEVKEELRQTVGGLEPALLSVREATQDVLSSAPMLGPVWEKAPRPPSAEELRKRLNKAMGGSSDGAEKVCEFLALPFIHSPALQPEIRKLQAALDHCPEEAVLRAAYEQLKALEAELTAHGPLLPSSSQSGSASNVITSENLAEVSANAMQRVAKLVQRESANDAEVAQAAEAAAARAAAGREEFIRRVDAGLALGAVRTGGRCDSVEDLPAIVK